MIDMIFSRAHHVALAVREDGQLVTDYVRFIIQYSSIALPWYDYALTFGLEVKYIWGQRFRLSTALYACCRYALVGDVLYLLVISDKLGDKCDQLSKAIVSTGLLGRVAIIGKRVASDMVISFIGSRHQSHSLHGLMLYAIGIFMFSFIWARWDWHGWWYLSYIYPMSIAPVARIYQQVTWRSTRTKATLGSSFAVSLLLSTLMGVFEFSSALITFVRCMQTLRATQATNVKARHFFMLLLEQGVLYLIFAALFTVTAIVLNYRAYPGTFCQRLVNVIALPLSCIFTARFLLHLRCLEEQLEKGTLEAVARDEDQDSIGLGSLRFNVTHMSSIVADLAVDANIDNRLERYVSSGENNNNSASGPSRV